MIVGLKQFRSCRAFGRELSLASFGMVKARDFKASDFDRQTDRQTDRVDRIVNHMFE